MNVPESTPSMREMAEQLAPLYPDRCQGCRMVGDRALRYAYYALYVDNGNMTIAELDAKIDAEKLHENCSGLIADELCPLVQPKKFAA